MFDDFENEKAENIRKQGKDARLHSASRQWIIDTAAYKYSYNFTWLGRPIIQFPQDIVALQEVIWRVRPDLIVETGIARGGSLIFHASMLELLGGDGRVVGVETDLRDHNRAAIATHPMFRRISIIEGSSLAESTAREVFRLADGRKQVLLVLDSNHTHEHVLAELRLYSPLVRKGSYVIVFDTIIEDMPRGYFSDRPWDVGNNPRTAVQEFLRTNDRFALDEEIDNKLLISSAPGGYLKCVRD
jgi:cephalosporin hydroxylase